jgi:LVIVD repeat/Bacterial TSP3 repeat
MHVDVVKPLRKSGISQSVKNRITGIPSNVFRILILFLICLSANAQSNFLFYLIENRETGDVVRRGTVTDAGLLPNELILAPTTVYREWLYDPVTGLLGYEDIETPPAGSRFRIPPIEMRIPVAPDSDGDGLSDDAEYVIGTDPRIADTDGDGISDGVSVSRGLNPVQGRPVVTGVIASVDTPGTAVDVTAQSGVAVVAARSGGVVVFNATDTANPIRVAQVVTPGDAMRVAISGDLVAVADGASGVAVIDVSDPAQAAVVRRIPLGSAAQAIAVAASLAFVGTSDGQVVTVDLTSGIILARNPVDPAVYDLALQGDTLFVLAVMPFGNKSFN